MPQTIIIIPCYNEAKRLDCRALTEFSKNNAAIGLWLVDDGSTDDTWEIISSLTVYPNIRGIRLPENQGKAEAVRQGFLAALQEKPRMIGFWDADLATPLNMINRFLAKFQDSHHCRMVTGCRLVRLGARIHRKPLRHYLGRIFATIVSIHLKLKIYDTQCGAKIMTAEYAEAVSRTPFVSKWFFDVEIYKRLIKHYGHEQTAGSVYEYPLPEWYDRDGSKIKVFRTGWQFLKVLLVK